MILHPLPTRAPDPSAPAIPAWDAVLRTQRESGDECLLITQDDHAHLAGEIAAAFRRQWLPQLTDEIVHAIRMHDCGWRPLDDRMSRNGESPVSFIDMSVPEFLVAWTASIDSVVAASALGGAVVSTHFCRLAEFRLQLGIDPAGLAANLRGFVAAEESRRAGLSLVDRDQVAGFTDVLQLCDLISLYLCCGATEVVEFQQLETRLKLGPCPGGGFRFDPPVLAEPFKAMLRGRHWPKVTPEGAILYIAIQ